MRMAMAAPTTATRLLAASGWPALFIALWSTGFIGGKAGLADAEAFTLITLRYALVVAVMAPAALVIGSRWPRGRQGLHAALVGVLLHGCYIGGVFVSIERGLPAGLSALIVGLQPLVTATLVGPLLGERVGARQWLGLALGLLGVALVVGERASLGEARIDSLAPALLALAGITIGTLYQKRFGGGIDLVPGAVIQYSAAGLLMAVLAVSTETMVVTWTPRLIAALVWLALPLSIGAVSLLWILVRRGEAARVASLFYLTPAVTALIAWPIFGETLDLTAIAGMAITIVGVALVQRG